jgi:hypothetical protein
MAVERPLWYGTEREGTHEFNYTGVIKMPETVEVLGSHPYND